MILVFIVSIQLTRFFEEFLCSLIFVVQLARFHSHVNTVRSRLFAQHNHNNSPGIYNARVIGLYSCCAILHRVKLHNNCITCLLLFKQLKF